MVSERITTIKRTLPYIWKIPCSLSEQSGDPVSAGLQGASIVKNTFKPIIPVLQLRSEAGLIQEEKALKAVRIFYS